MITLDLQIAYDGEAEVPDQEAFNRWVDAALAHTNKDWELTIRVVDNAESQQLNHQYRGKDKPTNVLSFPFEVPEGIDLPLLGDLIISAPVVAIESMEQNKTCENHWAHMVIHGCLHLLGYDHIEDDEAHEMESLEIQLLASLGISNPYEEQ